MKTLTTTEVLDVLDQHRKAGLHVDARLFEEVLKPGALHLICLCCVNRFLELVWQSIDATRPLARASHPRTLDRCAQRLSGFDWKFQSLVDAGYPWFASCVEIDSQFNVARFGWLAVKPLTPSEKQETPGGTYYVYDGAHKSIVLAKKLLRRELEYLPVEALLLTPRRS
jgi:hypothetical protein